MVACHCLTITKIIEETRITRFAHSLHILKNSRDFLTLERFSFDFYNKYEEKDNFQIHCYISWSLSLKIVISPLISD